MDTYSSSQRRLGSLAARSRISHKDPSLRWGDGKKAVVISATIALLAACGSANGESKPAATSGEDGDDHIACAPGGTEKFAKDCAVERSEDQGKLFLTVRHPDGGFRRFEVMTDGNGLATADGAEDARIAIADGLLEVTVGADRYRFPATMKGGADNKPGGAVKDHAAGQ